MSAPKAEAAGLPDFGCPECGVAGGHYPTCASVAEDPPRGRMTTEAAGLGLTGVLGEHIELLWGASQAGHWYAYCRCGEWSATSESGEAVAESHRAHVAEELRAALTSPEVVEAAVGRVMDWNCDLADRMPPKSAWDDCRADVEITLTAAAETLGAK